MTREEAIKNLEMIRVAFVEPVTKEQRKLIDDTFDMAIKALEQEPKTGHWTERKIHEATGFFLPTCSECGKIQPYTHHTFRWNYCPNCGARIESEE